MTGVTFGSFDFASVEGVLTVDVIRPTADSRDVNTFVPGRLDPIRSPQPPGQKTITVRVFCEAADHDALRLVLRALYDGIYSQTMPAQLIADDETDRYWLGAPASPIAPTEFGGSTSDPFDIDFDVDPLAYDITEGVAVGTGPFNPDPAIIVPQGALVTGTATGDGNFTLNGRTFAWTGALGFITVDGMNFTVVDGSDLSQLAAVDLDSEFPQVVPGENSFTATGFSSPEVGWYRRTP